MIKNIPDLICNERSEYIVLQAPQLVGKIVQTWVFTQQNQCSTSSPACRKDSANKGVCTTNQCYTRFPACSLQTRVFA